MAFTVKSPAVVLNVTANLAGGVSARRAGQHTGTRVTRACPVYGHGMCWTGPASAGHVAGSWHAARRSHGAFAVGSAPARAARPTSSARLAAVSAPNTAAAPRRRCSSCAGCIAQTGPAPLGPHSAPAHEPSRSFVAQFARPGRPGRQNLQTASGACSGGRSSTGVAAMPIVKFVKGKQSRVVGVRGRKVCGACDTQCAAACKTCPSCGAKFARRSPKRRAAQNRDLMTSHWSLYIHQASGHGAPPGAARSSCRARTAPH